MAETQEIKVVREMYEASNRGDFARAREYFDPDVELIVPHTRPDPGVYHGRDALFRWFSSWYVTLFESWTVEIQRMQQFGYAVVIEHRLHGKGRSSGADVTEDSASVNTVRGGRIVRAQPHANLEDALRAARNEAARTEST